jgi:hypothetical protein
VPLKNLHILRRSNGAKKIHTQAKRQYYLLSIINRSNVFLASIVVKRQLKNWEVEQPVSDLCMRKQTKMAPKATEQTGVDKKKKGLGFYSKGSQFEFRKGSRLRCLKFLAMLLDSSEETQEYYLDCTADNS